MSLLRSSLVPLVVPWSRPAVFPQRSVFFMLDWNSLQHPEDNNLSIFLIFNEATWNLKFSFHKQLEKGRNRAQQKASALYLRWKVPQTCVGGLRQIRIAAVNMAAGQHIYMWGETVLVLDMDRFTGSTSQTGLTQEVLLYSHAGDLTSSSRVCYRPTQTTVNNLRWRGYVIQKNKIK